MTMTTDTKFNDLVKLIEGLKEAESRACKRLCATVPGEKLFLQTTLKQHRMKYRLYCMLLEDAKMIAAEVSV